MKTQLKKAVLDLLKSPSQSLLLIFALSLGIWGFGSVLASYSILVSDLKTNFNQTNPPHAIIKATKLTDIELVELKNKLLTNSIISSIEQRDFAVLRVEERPGEWIPLWFFGVDNFDSIKLGRFFTEQGQKSPTPGSLAIERNGMLITKYDLGKNLKVRSGSKTLQIPITAIVFDPGQAPATQEHFLYAYADQATWATISEQPSGKRFLVRFQNAHSLDDVKTLMASLNLGPTVEVELPKFEEHPHEWQLNILMLMIAFIGFLALILSAVIISQVMSAMLKKQVRHIGIMKSIGASWAVIIRQYAFYIFLVASASLIIALPLALVTGQAFSDFVATTINFDIITRPTPFWVIIVLVVSGFFLPLLFAWLSLYKSASMSIRQSLSDPAVTVIGPLTQKLPRAMRSVLRNKTKTIVVILSVALGVMVFNLGFNIRESLRAFINETGESLKYDIQVATSELVETRELTKLVDGMSGIKDLEYWIGGKGELESKIAGQISGIGVIALPANTTHFKPEIVQGRWFSNSLTNPIEIVVNQNGWDQLKKPSINQEFTVTLGTKIQKLKLVGILSEADRPKIYLDYDIWAQIKELGTKINTLSISLKNRDYEKMLAVKSELEARIESSSLPVFYVISQAERVKIIADHLDIVLIVLILLSFLILAIGSIGTANAQTIRIMERTREIGVLRAIGASSRQIMNQFVTEGMLVSVVGLALGIIGAQMLSSTVANFFGTLMMGEGAKLSYAFSQSGFWLTLGISLSFAFVSSLGPARTALRIPTRKALSYE